MNNFVDRWRRTRRRTKALIYGFGFLFLLGVFCDPYWREYVSETWDGLISAACATLAIVCEMILLRIVRDWGYSNVAVSHRLDRIVTGEEGVTVFIRRWPLTLRYRWEDIYYGGSNQSYSLFWGEHSWRFGFIVPIRDQSDAEQIREIYQRSPHIAKVSALSPAQRSLMWETARDRGRRAAYSLGTALGLTKREAWQFIGQTLTYRWKRRTRFLRIVVAATTLICLAFGVFLCGYAIHDVLVWRLETGSLWSN